jgi:transposase
MQLITILHRRYPLCGFVYQQVRFTVDTKSIEVVVRPRKGSTPVCSRCHQPASGYDQLPERRFEFVPFWGYVVFLLYSMRRVNCRHCDAVVVEEVPWVDRQRQLTKAYLRYLGR